MAKKCYSKFTRITKRFGKWALWNNYIIQGPKNIHKHHLNQLRKCRVNDSNVSPPQICEESYIFENFDLDAPQTSPVVRRSNRKKKLTNLLSVDPKRKKILNNFCLSSGKKTSSVLWDHYLPIHELFQILYKSRAKYSRKYWILYGDFLRTKDNSLLFCAIPVIRKTCFFLSEIVYFLFAKWRFFCLTRFDLFKFIVNYLSVFFVTCVASKPFTLDLFCVI